MKRIFLTTVTVISLCSSLAFADAVGNALGNASSTVQGGVDVASNEITKAANTVGRAVVSAANKVATALGIKSTNPGTSATEIWKPSKEAYDATLQSITIFNTAKASFAQGAITEAARDNAYNIAIQSKASTVKQLQGATVVLTILSGPFGKYNPTAKEDLVLVNGYTRVLNSTVIAK